MLSDIADHDDEVLDLFKRIQENHSSKTKAEGTKKTLAVADTKEENETPVSVSIMYTFQSLSTLIKLARMSENLFDGINSLYKDEKNKAYILVITKHECNKSSFNKICNMLSEYGELINAPGMSEVFLKEHNSPLIVNHALQTLAQV